ncbi:hypothetical protein SAY86_029690 [Trapa natans]|uniref:Non-specific lipid-transfer protein n=1 Tax=Trapa natans TaxID=22666 RepID=A0AAN7M2L0_TRANT|nr:hypothetical protein SAY86_029690 [Trapa natans]
MGIPVAAPKLACLSIVLVIVATAAPMAVKASISCNTVVNDLVPCLNYVIYGGQVPTACCTGVQAVYNAARTTQDRQGVCSCLKSLINGYPISNAAANNAAALPSRCGINLPYKISPYADCRSVR